MSGECHCMYIHCKFVSKMAYLQTHWNLVALVSCALWAAILCCKSSTSSLRTVFLSVMAVLMHVIWASKSFWRLSRYWLFTVCLLASSCLFKCRMIYKKKEDSWGQSIPECSTNGLYLQCILYSSPFLWPVPQLAHHRLPKPYQGQKGLILPMEEEVYLFQSAKDKTMHEAAQVAVATSMSFYCKCVKAISHILVVTFTRWTRTHSIQSFTHNAQHTSITHVITALKQGRECQASVIHTIRVHMRLHHVQIQQLKEYYIHIGQLRAQGSCISYKTGQYTMYWPAFCFDTWLHHASTWVIAVRMWCIDIRKRLFVTATDGSDSELPNWLQHLQRKAFFCSNALNLLAKHVKSWMALCTNDTYQ